MQESLLNKLDSFIRKYYKNQIIKGVIYSLALMLSVFLLVTLLEYIGKFSTSVRSILFFSTIAIFLAIVFHYIISPLLKLNKIGKRINHENAASIIGTHFTNVQDKLLNTLQLINVNKNTSDKSLVYASIDQRIAELKPIPFTAAIDFNENKKYLKYLLFPVVAILIILLFNAKIISESADRLVNYQSTFIPQAPFDFTINNKNLSVIQNNDFTIDLSITGDQIPDEVKILYDGKEYKLNKINKNSYNYTFSNVQKDKEFYFEAAGFRSKNYELISILSPTVSSFKTFIDYPSHTGLIDEELDNIGDLNVPQGTKVKWVFNTKNTKKINLSFEDSNVKINRENQNTYSFEKRILKEETYTVLSSNDEIENKEVSKYFIQVKGDEYPQISVNETKDSINEKLLFFQGSIVDDYGFSNLTFTYRKSNIDSSGKESNSDFVSIPIPFNKNFNKDNFLHFFNFSEIGLQLGERVEYYFQVWDNDALNGYKSAKSKTKFLKAPTKEELEKELENKNNDIKKDLKETVKDAEKLKEDINKLKEEMLSKKNLDWKDKKKIDNILNQQKELQKQIDQINNQNEQKNQQKEEFNKQQSEDLKNKEEKLQDMMKELQSPEMQELYKKLEKLSEKLDKNELQETLEQIDMENIDLKKELERSLEMFKQMEMDEKLDEIAEKLQELAEKQEELAKNDSIDSQEKEESQEEINKEFEEVEKEVDELKEKNEELENKKDLDDIDSKEEEIKDDLKKSLDQLQKQQDAKQQQQDASEKMKQMANEMQSMMSMNNQEQQQENMEDLRALLENLITLSFDQEDVMNQLKTTSTNDPKYVKLGQQQNKLKDDAKMIEDSLFALSLRVEQIQSIVNKEINDINVNIKNAIGNIEKRKTSNATVNQQLTMTAINNLALLLDEALKQMQQQMANKTPGSGSCNNPGGNSPKPSLMPSMKDAQQGVSESLKKLREQMGKQKGKSPGKEGEDGENGSGGQSAKELARMAAEQAAIRDAVKQMGEQLNKDGSGAGNELKKIEKDMEKVEEDIINNQITQETIKRQQEILTRLLESEKAIREREFDKQRESKSVKNPKISNPEQFLEYKKKKEQELELLKTISPALVPYYKNKVNEYFNNTYE